jgi:outer membrane murein-binding lipoprotein Lpp
MFAVKDSVSSVNLKGTKSNQKVNTLSDYAGQLQHNSGQLQHNAGQQQPQG